MTGHSGWQLQTGLTLQPGSDYNADLVVENGQKIILSSDKDRRTQSG
jgi:hypothetical protein